MKEKTKTKSIADTLVFVFNSDVGNIDEADVPAFIDKFYMEKNPLKDFHDVVSLFIPNRGQGCKITRLK